MDTRQDAEHRLANLVSRWVNLREEKSTTVREYNEDLKKLEEAIEKLSGEIQGGSYQASLPFEEPKKPTPAPAPAVEATGTDGVTVTLDESDPDVQDHADDPNDGVICITCGHVGRFHYHPDGSYGSCTVLGCRCRGFAPRDPLGLDDYDPKEAGHEAT